MKKSRRRKSDPAIPVSVEVVACSAGPTESVRHLDRRAENMTPRLVTVEVVVTCLPMERVLTTRTAVKRAEEARQGTAEMEVGHLQRKRETVTELD